MTDLTTIRRLGEEMAVARTERLAARGWETAAAQALRAAVVAAMAEDDETVVAIARAAGVSRSVTYRWSAKARSDQPTETLDRSGELP